MKIKILFLLLLFSCSVRICFGQNFYEVKWTGHDGVNYLGFLIYNSDNDALMRVKYKANGVYKVAEYKCTGRYFTANNGRNYYLVDGSNAHVVYNGGTDPRYSADKFLFTDLDAAHHFKNLYAYDESDLQKSNLAELMQPAVWRKLDPTVDFSEAYIYDFYDKSEHNYTALLSLMNSPRNTTVYHNTSVKLYLVIVANTLDNSIGNGCEVDRKKLVTEMHDIASALNISVEDHIIYGTDFSSDNVMNTINAISPSQDDIVMFFYRGHGFRWNDQQSSWPCMSMRYSNYQPFTSISMDDVYSKIVAKGARLNMIFGDLCNSNIGVNQVTFQGSNTLQSNFYPDIDKLKHLFLDSKGTLMSVAASPGEVSWTNSYDGGFFTCSFFESLHSEIGKFTGSPSWKNILVSTINKAVYKSQNTCSNCTVQHGEYYISPDLANQ